MTDRPFDPLAIRADFPLFERDFGGRPLAYLDSAATSLKPRAVLDAVGAYNTRFTANIHRGIYTTAEEATAAYEAARAAVARHIGAAEPAEIVFVRNATEAINLVAYSWGRGHIRQADTIVLTELEHHSNLVPWQLLADSPAPPPDDSSAPLPASPALAARLGDRILRIGDTGDLVRAVQSALAKLGHGITETGNYDLDISSAVADFQAKHGLEVDGEVGPATARVIDAVLASADATRKPAVPADVPPPLADSPAPPPDDSPTPSPAPPTLAAQLGDRILRMGDTGDVVRAVQSALAKLGYRLAATGNYDRDSLGAVAGFQAKHGLEVDGEVGPGTARAIDAVLAPANAADKPDALVMPVTPDGMLSPGDAAQSRLTALLGDQSLRIGDQGDLVREFQLALARLGYQLTGTGTFGGATDTAVTHFQQNRGLEVDGEIGPQTAAAIDAALAEGGSTSVPSGKQSPAGPRDGGATPDHPIWLLEGFKWLNTREAPGAADNPDILGDWVPGEGGTIAKSYHSDSIPWCALYANMVLTKVGLPGTETLWALDWANWGTRLPGPAVGAFAPMKRKGGGHIAIVVGRDQHNRLMLLGGNQDDAVNIAPYPADRPLSFRWPKEVPAPGRTGFKSLPLVRSESRGSSVKES